VSGNWGVPYTSFLYTVRANKINSVSPGVIFYYNKITIPGGDITVVESNDKGWRDMLVQDLGQAILYDLSCNKFASASSSNGTVTFSNVPAGTYIIGIKYSPANLVGQPVTKSGGVYPTSIYTWVTKFNTALQPGSEASIPVAPKK
jgi:hypothetical protein